MRLLLRRELACVLGHRGMVCVVAAHVAIAAIFVIAWGDGHGVPLWWQRSFYQQLRIVQWATVTIFLPWAAVRCPARERRNELLLLSLVTGLTPSRVLG